MEVRIRIDLLRLVRAFCKEIAAADSRASWLIEAADEIPPDAPDNAMAIVSIPDSMHPFMVALFFVGRKAMGLPPDKRFEVARHIAKALPKIRSLPSSEDVASGAASPIGLDLAGIYSALHEAVVFTTATLAGIQCEFIPRQRNKRTPDITCPEEKVLVECKDSLSEVGIDGNRDNIVRKLQELIRDADDQLSQFDPEARFAHLIVVDLPEGTVSLIKGMTQQEREKFNRDILNLSYTDEDAQLHMRTPVVSDPAQVLFSDFDYGVFQDTLNGGSLREPLWIPTPFYSPEMSQRLLRFVVQFLGEGYQERQPIEEAPR